MSSLVKHCLVRDVMLIGRIAWLFHDRIWSPSPQVGVEACRTGKSMQGAGDESEGKPGGSGISLSILRMF